MKIIKYLIEFIIIIFFFILFKILGRKLSTLIGSKIGILFGPIFRSKKKIIENINKCFPDLSSHEVEKIIKNMWSYYGMIFSEYVFLKKFRYNNRNDYIWVEGADIVNKINKTSKPVIFISGHFDNFELMAMQIEKMNVKLAAIYRPLNNFFLNPIMEHLRKKYICKKQIKKGKKGIKELLHLFKNGYSIALMIDQRVSEGETINFFNYPALTTTIPAQFVKKYDCQIVPVFIERQKDFTFNIKFLNPITFEKSSEISDITQKLNTCLEGMIKTNPNQWIWSHNRWK